MAAYTSEKRLKSETFWQEKHFFGWSLRFISMASSEQNTNKARIPKVAKVCKVSGVDFIVLLREVYVYTL